MKTEQILGTLKESVNAYPSTVEYEAFVSNLPGWLPTGALKAINIFPHGSRGITDAHIDFFLKSARANKIQEVPDFIFAYVLGYKRWINSRWNDVVCELYPTDPLLINELHDLLQNSDRYQLAIKVFYEVLDSLRYGEAKG